MSLLGDHSLVRTLLVIYLIATLSLGPVAASATTQGTAGDGASTIEPAEGLDDHLLNETTNTTENTTDTVENTTDETTDTTENTTNETTATVENTTDETTTLIESTTDTIENTTDGSFGTLEGPVSVLEETTTDMYQVVEGGTAVLVEATTDNNSETDIHDEDQTEVDGAHANATTPADRATTTGPNVSTARSGGGDDPTFPLPASVGIGAVVVGAAGVTVLSAGTSGVITTPSVARAGASLEDAASSARTALRGLPGRLWRIGAALKYSRWDDSDPLEHDTRREVFDTVEDSPGIYLSKLDGLTDGSLSSLRHHLRILEDEGLITTEKVRGKRRYFPVQRGSENLALLAALDDPATEAILTTLVETGPVSGGDLAAELDRDPSTVSHHLSRLEEEGIVERERDGRAVVNRLSETAAMALSESTDATNERTIPADD